jgi:hypothetical protein
MASLCLDPRSPLVVRETDGQSVCETRERHLQQHGFVGELLEPPFVAQASVCKAEVLKTFRVSVHEREHTELLRKSLELAERGSSLGEIDEMSFNPAFCEKSERLTSIHAFLDAEDLDFHE